MYMHSCRTQTERMEGVYIRGSILYEGSGSHSQVNMYSITKNATGKSYSYSRESEFWLASDSRDPLRSSTLRVPSHRSLRETILRFAPRRTTDHLCDPLNLAIGTCVPPIHHIPNEVHGILQTSSSSRW